MIDGGDGFFYGTTLEGILKLEKSSLEFMNRAYSVASRAKGARGGESV